MPEASQQPSSPSEAGYSRFTRRSLLTVAGVGVAGAVGYPLVRRMKEQRARVFIARNQKYDSQLVHTIREGLLATGLTPDEVRDRRVLLKPNLVEPHKKSPHLTTDPQMVLAAAEVFRGWDAKVIVGEGPGHVRDTEMALVESRMLEALEMAELAFADLNYEEVGWLPNRGGVSKLQGFHFPRSVVEADLIVSMPKLKTHHWVGFTASMKNLYGTIPGIKYGWPKNVLHHAGIPQTVFDINASLPKTIAIVDGILCMEGDGPIMGSPKHMGLVIVGKNPTAVDATIARIMGLNPARVSYLQLAADRLGPISDSNIRQQGEGWRDVADPFSILNEPHLKSLKAEPGSLLSGRIPPAASLVV